MAIRHIDLMDYMGDWMDKVTEIEREEYAVILSENEAKAQWDRINSHEYDDDETLPFIEID